MKLQFKIDNLKEGRGNVIARADLTLQLLKGDGKPLDLVTVKECGLCPSRKGGYALLSPSRQYEVNGETRYANHVGWPQTSYDGAVNALMNAATEAGLMGTEQPQQGVTRAQLQSAGLVESDIDPNDPFAE